MKTTADQERIYNIGMSYMQQAFAARMAGDKKQEEFFSHLFMDLCEIASKNLKNASSLIQDIDHARLCQLCDGRISLTEEYQKVILAKDPEAKKAIAEAMSDSQKSYEIGRMCFTKRIPIPEIQESDVSISKPVSNAHIPPDILHLSIDNITCEGSKSTFQLSITPPKADSDPILTETFLPGKLKFQYNFSCIHRNKEKQLLRLLKRKLIIELHMIQKKLFGSNDTIISRISIPLELLAAKSHVTQTFIMQNAEGSNIQATITVTLSAREALITPEIELYSVKYAAIKKGQKLQKPALSTPKTEKPSGPRQMTELSKEELLALKPKIQVGRVMPEWELKRFMSLELLKKFVLDTGTAITAFREANVAIPPKLSSQFQHLNQKISAIVGDLQSGKLSKQTYIQLVKRQIQLDQQELQKVGSDSPEGKILQLHIDIMINPPKKKESQ